MKIPATTSQTVGPYYRIGLGYQFTTAACTEHTPGEHISVQGVLYDGFGLPVPDAQLEIWQADYEGRLAGIDAGSGVPDAGFRGFARIALDDAGRFLFRTVKPGSIIAQETQKQAPHISIMIFMRGLLKHLYTRMYFEGDPMNESDPTLQAVPQDQRHTLLAQPVAGKPGEYTWNIHLQGQHETAFFYYR